MEVIVAEHFGMCFGVRDALKEAERLVANGPLTILGELVHNPVVRERLSQLGVREGSLDQTSSARTEQVMITAHGAADAARHHWKRAGYAVADGTCPLVRHAHEQLRLLVQSGYFPVVVGKNQHVEVRGLVGDFPNAIVIDAIDEIDHLPMDEKRFGIIAQTTQPIEKVNAIVGALRIARPDAQVKFCDTVCRPTKNRQKALRELLTVCDVVVVVGGRQSNNTRELVATANAAGVRAIHIENVDDLSPEMLLGAKRVGLTAGTSTLKETVAAVHARLLSFAPVADPP